MDLLLDVEVVIVVVFVEVDLHMWQLCKLRPCTWGSTLTSRGDTQRTARALQRGCGIRPDLARGSTVTRRALITIDCSCELACSRDMYTCVAKPSLSGGSCTTVRLSAKVS